MAEPMSPDEAEWFRDINNFESYEAHAFAILERLGVEYHARFIKHGQMHWDRERGHTRDIFQCTLRRGSDIFTCSFGQSIMHSDGKGSRPPTTYDLLAAIGWYEPADWPDWAYEFGYDLNKKDEYQLARKTHKLCRKEWNKVHKMFTESERDVLSSIA